MKVMINVNRLKGFRLKTEESEIRTYLYDNDELYAQFKIYRAKFPRVSARRVIMEMLKFYKYIPHKFI